MVNMMLCFIGYSPCWICVCLSVRMTHGGVDEGTCKLRDTGDDGADSPSQCITSDPAFAEFLFFATIETVCTSVIIWHSWTWSELESGSLSQTGPLTLCKVRLGDGRAGWCCLSCR